MAPLTDHTPKPLLPALNCPLVVWNIALLRKTVGQVRINTHYLHAAFDRIGNLVHEIGIPFEAFYEPELTGPFGGVLSCCRSTPSPECIIVLTGDGYFDADLTELARAHQAVGADLTIGVATVVDGSRYGVVTIQGEGEVVQMREKPTGVGATDTASCGVYILSGALLSRFQHTCLPLDWVDVVAVLLAEGRDVRAANVGRWQDAGSPEDLLALNLALLNDDTVALVADRAIGGAGSFWRQGIVHVAPGVEFNGRVLLGTDAMIESGARLENAVIGPGARIGSGTQLVNSMVLPGAIVPPGTHATNVIRS